MRNIINIASKVLTAIIIILGSVLALIVMTKADGDMARNFIYAYQEIGITLNMLSIGTYVVIGLAAFLVLGFSVYNLFLKPKAAINVLIGIAILAIIIIVSFAISSTEMDPKFVSRIAANVDVTDALSKQVGAGLITTYILGALAILSIIYSWVSKLIKG